MPMSFFLISACRNAFVRGVAQPSGPSWSANLWSCIHQSLWVSCQAHESIW